jgi:phospholipid/cholesterol/gamma-HCH transport system substrate-binding protein
MRRSSFLTVEQLRVGAVVLVTLAILLYGGYRLGQQAHLFSRRYELVAFVPNASGLRAGGSVTVAGQLVGTVREVEFLAPDADTTKNLRLVLEVEENVREQIRADSRARLRTQGLLGDKVFDISPGTTRYNVLAAGDTIPIEPSLDYDEIVQTASGAVDDLVGLTKDLREVSGGIARGEGTVGQLVTNRALYDELTQTLDQTNRLIARMQNPNGTVGRLLDDPQLYRNLVRVTAAVDSLTRAVSNSQGTVGKLLTDDSLYVRLVGVAAGADSITKLLTRGNGLAARLLTDQESYDRLNKTLTELNEILADVRRNPGRYTKGIIRVF